MSRRVAIAAIAIFFLFQGSILVDGLTGAGKFHWIMFVGRTARQYYLEVNVITPRGDVVPVPLEEAMPFHMAQTEWRAFDEPFRKPSRREVVFARWLGAFMQRRGVEVSGVELGWRIHDLDTGEVSRLVFASYPMEGPP